MKVFSVFVQFFVNYVLYHLYSVSCTQMRAHIKCLALIFRIVKCYKISNFVSSLSIYSFFLILVLLNCFVRNSCCIVINDFHWIMFEIFGCENLFQFADMSTHLNWWTADTYVQCLLSVFRNWNSLSYEGSISCSQPLEMLISSNILHLIVLAIETEIENSI